MDVMDFTYNSYKYMVTQLQKNGYTICGYDNYENYNKCAILRHDMDESLESAIPLAEIEHNLGVSATYFVLLSTDLYNIASNKSLGLISQIRSLGHNIGLHFDEAKYCNFEDIVKAVEREKYILALILDMPITAVSMHRPSKKTLAANYEFDNAVNTYSKNFFEEFKYVSDSRCLWREPVLDIIKSNQHNRLQILTHPIWYAQEQLSPQKILKQFIRDAEHERYIQMKENTMDFDEFVKEEEIRRDLH